MNNLSYLRLIWKTNRGFALFSMAFITLLQFLILYLITTFDTSSIINVIISQLPEKVKIFLNNSFFNTLTLDGAAAFGLNHPMVLALMSITAISIPVHHISREIESGAMELLLSHPFRRQTLILYLWVSGCLILLAIAMAALAGSVTAIYVFHHLTMNVFWKIVQISLNLWLLFVLIMSYTLLISTAGKAGNIAGNLSAVITFMFYLLFFLSEFLDSLKFTKPFIFFSYYEPQKIMFNKGHFLLDCVVLLSLILISLVMSLWLFKRRDIP